MQSIPTLFVRDAKGRATAEVAPGCEWAIAGEGIATVKIDGSACMVRGGRLFKRLAVRDGSVAPAGWESCHGAGAFESGHGWIPVGDRPEGRWHREASLDGLEDGTYELVGPKIQRNPYGLEAHILVRHGAALFPVFDMGTPRNMSDIDFVRYALADVVCEGIVWHHTDGRMVKIKRRDFGIRWPQEGALLDPRAAVKG